jgi:hypothetical protein
MIDLEKINERKQVIAKDIEAVQGLVLPKRKRRLLKTKHC